MFRFTIRDVLWLMVVVGLAIGWMIHVRSEMAKRDTTDVLRQQLLEQNLVQLQSAIQRLEELETRQSTAQNRGQPNSN
jgi:Tfp pilus assembly protein PilN